MILVDQEVRDLCLGHDKMLEPYEESCLTCVGYDLRAESFIMNGEEVAAVDLQPGAAVMVGTVERIHMPGWLLGRIAIKNSRMRQGLSLEAPVFQPGHHGKVYFRLLNVSEKSIHLEAGEKYGMMVFERLSRRPEALYDGRFQGETKYMGNRLDKEP